MRYYLGVSHYPHYMLKFIFLNTICLTSRVTHQNDRNCLENIFKFEKIEIFFFLSARGHFKVNYCKVSIYLLVHGPEAVTMHPHYSYPKHEMICYH